MAANTNVESKDYPTGIPLEDVIDVLPLEDLERLREILSPWRLKEIRLERRNEMIREAAARHFSCITGDLPKAVAAEMKGFAAVGYRRSSVFNSPRDASFRAVLKLNDGKTLGSRSIRKILNRAI